MKNLNSHKAQPYYYFLIPTELYFKFQAKTLLLPFLWLILSFPLVGQQVVGNSHLYLSEDFGSPPTKSNPISSSYSSSELEAVNSLLGWDFEDLFDEPDFFEEKSLSISLALGLRTNVNLSDRVAELDQIDVEALIPGVSLLLERQIWDNLGLGISLSYQSWEFSPLNYTYQYITGGLRTSYHLNLDFIEKLDPYLGAGASFRMILLSNSERNISENRVTPHLILGSRYYLNETIGVFIEVSDDTNSWFKVGSTLYFE